MALRHFEGVVDEVGLVNVSYSARGADLGTGFRDLIRLGARVKKAA